MLTKDAFIQVEAAYTQYDSISARIAETTSQVGGLLGGESNKDPITRTFTAADPELMEGRITLGFKF